MKRKIAAIFAADIAGYCRLVAEDEEETLRRLASYRQVTDDFIAKGGGRIFNTAGDAVLAEFPSAVEAVRCAIDIQESLRTRNMAYPPSRQMAFRIGITIGDVVERDGDLLGDGVNIAARLEGLAEVGGICISRAVHEQVANKLSVQFADIGAQEVKNIPTPVHAYMVAMRREDGTYATPQVKKPVKAQGSSQPNWMWPVAVTRGQPGRDRRRRFSLFRQAGDVGAVKGCGPEQSRSRAHRLSPRPPPVPAASAAPAAGIAIVADGRIVRKICRGPAFPLSATRRAPACDPTTCRPPTSRPSRSMSAGSALPSPRSRARRPRNRPRWSSARSAPMPRNRHGNANSTRSATPSFMRTAGRHAAAALDQARRRDRAALRGQDVPLTREAGKARLENVYAPARKNKALAIGPGGALFFPIALDSVEEAVRRAPGVLRRDRRRPLHDRRAQR